MWEPLPLENNARLAQSVERKTLNLVVVGSSPTVVSFQPLLLDVFVFELEITSWKWRLPRQNG
jgi:hypothetical protein